MRSYRTVPQLVRFIHKPNKSMKKFLLFLKARSLAAAISALIVSTPQAGAEGTAQNPNARLNFTFRQTEVKKILEEVEKQSDYYFVYNHEQVNCIA